MGLGYLQGVSQKVTERRKHFFPERFLGAYCSPIRLLDRTVNDEVLFEQLVER